MALYRLRSGVLYETGGRQPAGSTPVEGGDEPRPGVRGGVEPARNASRDAWAAYAQTLGVPVDGLGRNAIIELLAGSAPVDPEVDEERIDAAQGSDPVGADVLVDQQAADPEELVDGPAPATTAGEDLDSDNGIVGHED